MTIINVRYLDAALSSTFTPGPVGPKPPERVFNAIEAPFKGYQQPPSAAFEQSSNETAIVIDNGKPFIEPLP